MSVSSHSRYHGITVYEFEDARRRARPAIAIRRYEPADSTDLFRHRLVGSEDLELLAAQYYRNSEEWWRIADTLPLQFPWDVAPGDVVPVPSPADMGRVTRTRRFG